MEANEAYKVSVATDMKERVHAAIVKGGEHIRECRVLAGMEAMRMVTSALCDVYKDLVMMEFDAVQVESREAWVKP